MTSFDWHELGIRADWHGASGNLEGAVTSVFCNEEAAPRVVLCWSPAIGRAAGWWWAWERPASQAVRAGSRWRLHYYLWATLLRRQRPSFGPVFQDHAEKAFLSFQHVVTELSPNQCTPTVGALCTGQHFSQCVSDAISPCPSRVHTEWSQGLECFIYSEAWAVAHDSHIPCFVCHWPSLHLPGPSSCSWLSRHFLHQNMLPPMWNLVLRPTQTGSCV